MSSNLLNFITNNPINELQTYHTNKSSNSSKMGYQTQSTEYNSTLSNNLNTNYLQSNYGTNTAYNNMNMNTKINVVSNNTNFESNQASNNNNNNNNNYVLNIKSNPSFSN
jgi:hypothetical protein